MSFVKIYREGRTSIVSLNRPERLNAIGLELLEDLHTALCEAQNDPQTQVIILTGEGRAFCAGDDLKEYGEYEGKPDSATGICQAIQQISRDLMLGPKLVIGAMSGYAVGGGFEWLLNCDFVIASEDLVCFFPEMSLGHFVTGGVTVLLPLGVGYHKAMELLVLGEHVDADALLKLGLIYRKVAADELMPAALHLARQLETRSEAATMQLKRLMISNAMPKFVQALDDEERAAAECFYMEDTVKRIRAFTENQPGT